MAKKHGGKRKPERNGKKLPDLAGLLVRIANVSDPSTTTTAIYFKIGSWLHHIGSGGAPNEQTTVIEVRNSRAGERAAGAYFIFGPSSVNPSGGPFPPAFDETHRMVYIFYRLDQIVPVREMLNTDGTVYVYYAEFGVTTWAEVQSIPRP
jgi:hypothetical protein